MHIHKQPENDEKQLRKSEMAGWNDAESDNNDQKTTP